MELESDTEHNHNMMIDHKIPAHNMQIDPSRSCFPCCIVWTPLPVVSWLLPFVSHIGIGREDGVILDFAGPNFVCVDNFTFGGVTRYIQISKDKICKENMDKSFGDCSIPQEKSDADITRSWSYLKQLVRKMLLIHGG
ncbi:unnamed protein product [Lactuca saligna]|uniref:Uncharacterized protein n=1 Tax=Lactuca saligna TaxID=75948 RepID=A0AA35ZF58_LACSI|nr:unnamed protein product [Lactuca saligna]